MPNGEAEPDEQAEPVLDEEKQYEIVPPPKPHLEAKLRKAAKEAPHILIHKPFNPYCEICNQAKLREAPHRKGTTRCDAKEFGEYTTGDFLTAKGETMRGVGGFKDALNLRDLGTGVKMCYPTEDRTTPECERALKTFGGATTNAIKRFYSDNEGGLIGACKKLDILQRKSQPGKPVTNSMAERANQDILAGSRSVLAQAGLPECFWPYAAPYYCLLSRLLMTVKAAVCTIDGRERSSNLR